MVIFLKHFNAKVFSIALLTLSSAPPAFAVTRCLQVFDGDAAFIERITDTQRLRGTFEDLLPPSEGSFAYQFRQNYSRLFLTFLRYPSHLVVLNDGLPPVARQTVADIYDNIQRAAKEVVIHLKHEAHHLDEEGIGDRRFWRNLLLVFAEKFEEIRTCRGSYCTERYDPLNKLHYNSINSLGTRFNSLWSELRVGMLVPNLNTVQFTVNDLIQEGQLTYVPDEVAANQEIDLLWTTEQGLVIGDVKAFDKPYRNNSKQGRKVREQLIRYVRVASQMNTPTDVSFFFIAGISPVDARRLENIGTNTNRMLLEKGVARHNVTVTILGDYTSHPHFSLHQYWQTRIMP